MKNAIKYYVTPLLNSKELKGFQGLFLFALIIISFHLLYKYFEMDIISVPVVSVIIDFLTKSLLITTNWIHEHILAINSVIEGDVLALPNGFSIEMQFGCSGFQQFVLLFLLFLIYPGSWKKKLWYIPVSLITLHILNLIRFVGISLYSSYYNTNFHLIHDWIFRPFIYLGIFLLWVLWAEVINKKPEPIT